MNNAEAIALALAAAAAAASQPNSFLVDRPEDNVVRAGNLLKAYLDMHYSGIDLDLLQIGPGNEQRQEQFQADLEQSGAADDAEVKKRAGDILATVIDSAPKIAHALNIEVPTVAAAAAQLNEQAEQ